jgi:hypothetical protein
VLRQVLEWLKTLLVFFRLHLAERVNRLLIEDGVLWGESLDTLCRFGQNPQRLPLGDLPGGQVNQDVDDRSMGDGGFLPGNRGAVVRDQGG